MAQIEGIVNAIREYSLYIISKIREYILGYTDF
jgi:hypothetical protein